MRNIGPTEILIILGIVVLLFGGRKLPELARGSGRALRIFKSEVKANEEETEAIEGPREPTATSKPVETAAQPPAPSVDADDETVNAEIVEGPRDPK